MKQVEVPEFNFESEESLSLYDDVVFHHEMTELLRGEVSYGEGDNKEKARRVLEHGSQQILNDETSSPFMRYVAICLRLHLEKSVSLDVAFNRKKGRGRPIEDPANFDHVIAAFYAAADDPTAADAKQCRELGFKAAFIAHHGKSEEEYKRREVDAKSIDNKKVATRKLLQGRGLYQIKRKKRT